MEPKDILLKYFGYAAFRPLQEEIIQSVLAGNDTLALLPTGGGKSICYQVPALLQPGICLVISPLIALMKDQIAQLKRRNIPSLYIHSGMTFWEVKKTLQNATSGQFKFLYVSPERLQTQLFNEFLPAIPISMVAVDEAHCISQWGYDFRPAYLTIAEIRPGLPKVPLLALTASATPEVQRDICNRLQFTNPVVFTQSFARPNLSFSVFNTPHKTNKLLEILQKVPGTALVYTRSRRQTTEISNWLLQQNIKANAYHAGLATAIRNQRQDDWIKGNCRVMVCTNAFGMGIDKPDVRVVVHMDAPDCPENYYQEAGRAGRDGIKSYAVLLYNNQDLEALSLQAATRFPNEKAVQNVYQAIANYLQLPSGAGEGCYFNFDLQQFCLAFKFTKYEVVYGLQALSQAGYVSFNESVFITPKVGFTANVSVLRQFEVDQPKYAPLIKLLLRTYEGIFDNEVNISEKVLAKYHESTEQEVQQQLMALQSFQIMQYQPAKDTPQLFFPYHRIPAEQVKIETPSYSKMKAVFETRVLAMRNYVLATECRSEFLQHYFGEKQTTSCGKCDQCLAKRKQSVASLTQLLQWQTMAFNNLSSPFDPQLLQQSLQITQTQLQQLIELCLQEELVFHRKDGFFEWTKKAKSKN